jgi:hypothetical protein
VRGALGGGGVARGKGCPRRLDHVSLLLGELAQQRLVALAVAACALQTRAHVNSGNVEGGFARAATRRLRRGLGYSDSAVAVGGPHFRLGHARAQSVGS